MLELLNITNAICFMGSSLKGNFLLGLSSFHHNVSIYLIYLCPPIVNIKQRV